MLFSLLSFCMDGCFQRELHPVTGSVLIKIMHILGDAPFSRRLLFLKISLCWDADVYFVSKLWLIECGFVKH